MAEPKQEFAMLSFDFMKMIAEESATLSQKASEFLVWEEKCPMLAMLKPELVMMQITLKSLSEYCLDALETCYIDDDRVVQVPAASFLQIADASAIGMNAVKEAEKYISFSIH